MKSKSLLIPIVGSFLLSLCFIKPLIASADNSKNLVHPQNNNEHITLDYDNVIPENTEEDREFDDSIKYSYSSISLANKTGTFVYDDGVYTSTTNDALATLETDPFKYGTFSCNFKTTTGSDSGILFSILDFDQTNYWETGVSYYFLYFSTVETKTYARLVAIYNGVYTELISKSYNVDVLQTYSLKVVLKSNKIVTYIDGALFYATKDINFIEDGFKVGFRAGPKGIGTTISDVSLTSEYLYEYE